MPSPLSRTLWTTKRGRIAAAAVAASALLVLTSCSLGDTSSTSTSAAAPARDQQGQQGQHRRRRQFHGGKRRRGRRRCQRRHRGLLGRGAGQPVHRAAGQLGGRGGRNQGFNMLPPTQRRRRPGQAGQRLRQPGHPGRAGHHHHSRRQRRGANAVASANAANIPVVTVDTAANGGKIYMNVRADNVAMGKSACEEIGKLTGDSGTVLELQGDLGTSSGADRHQGFADCMAASFPNVEIIAKPTDWKSAQAADQAQTVLSTTDVNAVFLASDAVMLDSVSNQMQNLSKWVPTGQDGHIGLVTIDGGANALAGIRGGQVDAVISQPINDYATFGVQYLQDAIAGKTQQAGPTDHNSQIVEYKGNLADLLPSPVVTTANVDDPDLWGNAAS